MLLEVLFMEAIQWSDGRPRPAKSKLDSEGSHPLH